MSTFNADIYIGNRGNTILSFDLYLGTGTTQNYNCSPDSGVTFNTFIHSGTTRVFQDIQWNNMYSEQTLFVDNIPIGTTHIKVVANRLSGVCNNLQPQIICIQGRPTPTPTPSSTPTSTPTPTPSPTTSPTPTATDIPPTPTPTGTLNCLFDVVANIVTPTPTPTSTTPPPTPTSTPISIWYQLTNCSDSSVEYSEEYPEGQFVINEKVTTPGNVWVITNVNTTTNPGGTLYAITSTGFMGCGGVATFSRSTISASRTTGAGTTTQTSGTTITVTYNTVTIKLSTWVISGYRSDTSITVNGSPISPEFAGQGGVPLSGTGEGNASFTTFTLPVGVYNVTDWTVSAISDGSQTIVQAKLEQVT